MQIYRYALAGAALVQAALASGFAGAQEGAADGERVFRTRCGSCHTLEEGKNRVGPHLVGVIGRTAGSVEGARYSKAMQGSGIVWDEERLDSYIGNPRKVVPGTTMTISLASAADRQAVIGYLKSLSAPGN